MKHLLPSTCLAHSAIGEITLARQDEIGLLFIAALKPSEATTRFLDAFDNPSPFDADEDEEEE